MHYYALDGNKDTETDSVGIECILQLQEVQNSPVSLTWRCFGVEKSVIGASVLSSLQYIVATCVQCKCSGGSPLYGYIAVQRHTTGHVHGTVYIRDPVSNPSPLHYLYLIHGVILEGSIEVHHVPFLSANIYVVYTHHDYYTCTLYFNYASVFF